VTRLALRAAGPVAMGKCGASQEAQAAITAGHAVVLGQLDRSLDRASLAISTWS